MRNSEIIHALFVDQLVCIKPLTYYMEPPFLPHFETNEAALMAPDDPSLITIYTLNFQLAQTLSSYPILESHFIQRTLHPRSFALSPGLLFYSELDINAFFSNQEFP